MITIDPEFDINKFTAEYLDKNIDRIARIGYDVLKGTKNSIKVKLRSTYTSYINKVAVRYAKTKSFFYRDEAVYIETFYIPLSLSFKKKILGKASLNILLNKGNNIIITGLAGCGKSILMKYLLLDTLKNSSYIPVFIELRDINKRDIDLMDLIEEVLFENSLGLDVNYFHKAFEEGQFIFFLDGFDEIDRAKRYKITKSIFDLTKKYNLCKIILSSRPDAEFGGWKDFILTAVCNLELNEACDLIEKIPYDDKIKNKFTEDLKKELFNKHKSFLSNPLLLSIMLLTYSQSANIPNKLNVFYNQAYEALFQRHDALKGGFLRKRFSDLDIQDYSKIFSAFCVQTYDKRISQFSKTEALEILKKIKTFMNIVFKCEDFLDDSLQSTCLLVEDGLFITFAHRSFQEYFTARFINESNSKIQIKLLNKFSHNLRYDSVFPLLYEMSPEMVERLFILPKLDDLFKIIKLKSKVGLTHFLRYMQLSFAKMEITENNKLRATFTMSSKKDYSDVIGFVLNQCGHLINWGGFKGRQGEFNFYDKYKDYSGFPNFNLSELDSKSELIRDLFLYGNFFSKETLEKALEIRNIILQKHYDSEASLEEILLN